jgi:hypothetical protein
MALGELGVPTSAARHPSYGGQSEFLATMYALYGIDEMPGKNEPALPLEMPQVNPLSAHPRQSYQTRQALDRFALLEIFEAIGCIVR